MAWGAPTSCLAWPASGTWCPPCHPCHLHTSSDFLISLNANTLCCIPWTGGTGGFAGCSQPWSSPLPGQVTISSCLKWWMIKMMKMVKMEMFSGKSYLVITFIWWKLSGDKNYLVIKVTREQERVLRHLQQSRWRQSVCHRYKWFDLSSVTCLLLAPLAVLL